MVKPKLQTSFTLGSTYEIELDAIGSFNEGESRDLTSINLPATEPEQALVLKFSGKEADIRLQLTLIEDGTDKANDTLEEGGISDEEFAIGQVVSNDTTNDEFTISGDITERTDPGDTVAIRNSTALNTNGTWTVSSVNYDSGNDETTVGVQEDVTDSTTDGDFFNGVVTLYEQKKFMQEVIGAPNTGATVKVIDYYLFSEKDEIHIQNMDFTKRANEPGNVLSCTVSAKLGIGVLI